LRDTWRVPFPRDHIYAKDKQQKCGKNVLYTSRLKLWVSPCHKEPFFPYFTESNSVSFFRFLCIWPGHGSIYSSLSFYRVETFLYSWPFTKRQDFQFILHPTYLLICHLLLLDLSVDVPFTCSNSWGYYATLECNRTGEAIGSSGRQWDPLMGINGDVTLKKNTAGRIVHSHLIEPFVWDTVMNFNCLTVTLVLRHQNAPYHNSIYRISHAIHHCRNKPYIHFRAVTIHTRMYLSLPTVI
jgi:hypothetical protein